MKSLDLSQIEHIYITAGYTDMRKGIDGLYMIIQSQLKLDPFSKRLFLFCGKKASVIKRILWEGNEFLLLNKRMIQVRFKWPRNHQEAEELTQQLRWLLEGLSIYQKMPSQRVKSIG